MLPIDGASGVSDPVSAPGSPSDTYTISSHRRSKRQRSESGTVSSENKDDQDSNNGPQATTEMSPSLMLEELLPLAPTLDEYLEKGGVLRYRPRPEWYSHHSSTRSCSSPPSCLASVNESSMEQDQAQEEADPSSDQEDVDQDTNHNDEEGGAPLQPQQAETPPPGESGATDNHNRPKTRVSSSRFGKDFDPALLDAIREGATDAALSLLDLGAPVESENAKGCTPLILATQKGNSRIVMELLQRGASPNATTVTGTTAVLQAAHFGHLDILRALLDKGGVRLMEVANYKHTTPLMRASQEGHLDVVRLLLDKGALVNRRNQVQMTSLMLASQRGHAKVCSLLIAFGADLDVVTAQNSTSLHLACKRSHEDVVRVLVTAGAEFCLRDNRGRTARDLVLRRTASHDDEKAKRMEEMARMIDPLVQTNMMQFHARTERSFGMMKLWNLLQQERANVTLQQGHVATIHQLAPLLERPRDGGGLPFHLSQPSTLALLRIMALPAPLVRLVLEFVPLPSSWDSRIGLLTKRCLVDSDAALLSALDLIDEILEEGGFLEACDAAQISPPNGFSTWVSEVFYTCDTILSKWDIFIVTRPSSSLLFSTTS